VIPIADPQITREEHDQIAAVLADGQLADGPETRAFEREFAEYCGTKHGVATANGTTALHAALEGLGIGAGDTVLTTPFSFIASANAPRLAGADVGFVDVDPGTYNLDVDRLAGRLHGGEDVDAVVVVHLYGLPAELDRLRTLATQYDFALVEDAAQAHGATYNGQRVGSFGDAGCFSFYPTKNMTTGEGGMITTDREDVATRASRFVDHGRTDGYEHVQVGHNFRMTSIAAAIGRVQLDRLPEANRQRRENAGRLNEGLSDSTVETPTVPDGRTHVYHQYTIRHERRDALQEHLETQGVGSAVYYPIPIHEQPAYDGADATAPTAEQLAEEVLSLPVHATVTESDTEQIIDAVKAFPEGLA
jgi:dTDP-4-amino-4,6-dideoxygalactose transaminase